MNNDRNQQSLEQKIADRILSILGDLYTADLSGSTLIDKFIFQFCPDIIISYKGHPVVSVEAQETIYMSSFALSMAKGSLHSFCNQEHIPYALLTDGEHAYLMQDSEYFAINEEVTLEDALSSIKNTLSSIKSWDINSLKQPLYQEIGKIAQITPYLSNEVKNRLSHIEISDLDWDKAKTEGTNIILPDSLQKKIFLALLGEYDKDKVCRYMSQEAFNRILNNGEMSLCSIVGMNDKSECFYAENYIKRTPASSENQLSKYQIQKLNEYFISSCSDIDISDNLTMWRMYTNDGKGVCVEFRVNIPKGSEFVLAPVSYAKIFDNPEYNPEWSEDEEKTIIRHPELDFIRGLMYCKIGGFNYKFSTFSFWSHFFKSHHYSEEHEVRLMRQGEKDANVEWIEGNCIYCPIIKYPIDKYPLVIQKIILGPKFAEKSINCPQLECYIKSKGYFDEDDVPKCEPSKIDNYR